MRLFVLIAGLMLLVMLAGCAAAPRNMSAIHAYYRYEFTEAREALRPDAVRNNEQVLLNNTRLGMAALAAADLDEAEQALGRSFELLSTAGLNRDRTTAAVFLTHEGIRIWKGEPFEQALMYYYVATLYALLGDWENVRAASANSLFRLTDFGGHRTAESLARRAATDPAFLDAGYSAVDSNFALGLVMQAIGAIHSGAGGADELLDDAMRINPGLHSVVQSIRAKDFDTLLIVDWGKGPTKVAYGPDNALVKFVAQEHASAPLAVTANGEQIASAPIIADVSQMARDHRWNNLEDVRRAKSAIGDVLMFGGAAAAYIGAQERSAEAAFAGLGAIGLGLLTKSGARADTRYLEFAPHAVYLVPLKIGSGPVELRVGAERIRGSNIILPDFHPGTTERPRAVYLRLHGPGSAMPAWLTAIEPAVHPTQLHAVPHPYTVGYKRALYERNPSAVSGVMEE